MKWKKRIRYIITFVLVSLLLMPCAALGAENQAKIDLDRNVSLTIDYRDGGKPLAGAAFQMYLVAELDADGNRNITDEFKRFPVNYDAADQSAWAETAETLGYLLVGNPDVKPAAEGKIGSDGKLVLGNHENLKPGMYLITGSPFEQNGLVYESRAFLIQLPFYAETWIYDVTAKTKHESAPDAGSDSKEGTSCKVLKVWDDKGYEQYRPQSITVQLFRDREVYDTVTLTANNNWRYAWEGLSDEYQWTVAEQTSGNYRVNIALEGITFVVTNSYNNYNPPGGHTPSDEKTPLPEDEEFPDTEIPTGEPPLPPEEWIVEPGVPLADKLPQTGQLWWPVALLISSGLVCIIIGLVLQRGEHYGA